MFDLWVLKMLTLKDVNRLDLPKQDNYERALAIGLEIFSRKDPGWTAEKAGGSISDGNLVVPHLNMHILLELETQHFSIRETDQEAPIWLSILCLHYLNSAQGSKPTGKLKHFREFKDGVFYEPAFNRRTKDILTAVFGQDPSPMLQAGQSLCGKILDSGDAAIELPYFPFVPITCVVWKGDDEFPPEATVLFDETADIYFSAEDMAVAAQMAVLELMRRSKL
ncbi:MAG: DUF3786 domain-containing protein [Desulfomonilaceae bacterium]